MSAPSCRYGGFYMSAPLVALFVCFCLFDSLRPSQQSFSYVGTGLPGLTSTKQGLMCLAQKTTQ